MTKTLRFALAAPLALALAACGSPAEEDTTMTEDTAMADQMANDDMAAGVLSVAHEREIKVPDQLSVAGFDDTPLARTVWPPLTSIHQPMAELARAATEILISGGDITHRRLPHDLIERGSVAPPFSKDHE